jgi:hypothetical protein
MPRQYLYQTIPTEIVETVLRDGFQPRPTTVNGVEQSARVWLYTDVDMAYYMAAIWFVHVLSDAERRIKRSLLSEFFQGTDIGWRWNGSEWRAVTPSVLSIIQIDRGKICCFPDEARTDLPRPLRRTIVWTPDHVPPPFTVLKLDREFFMSAKFHGFMAHDPAIRAVQLEQPVVRNGKIVWLKGKERPGKR